MITSKDNEKLKTVRKLRSRRSREKLGLFLTEGEDLLEAGLSAGAIPQFVLTVPDSGVAGEEVEPSLLDAVSALGSGTRAIAAWKPVWATGVGEVAVFLDGLGDPGNVGTIIRTVDALLEATVVIGSETADPFSPASVRASMGSVFTQPIVRGVLADTPEPRYGLVAGGGEDPRAFPSSMTLCLGSERGGLSTEALNQCEEKWTIGMRDGGPESLNVAAAAAIACERVRSGGSGTREGRSQWG
jgi:TrmH family RNA methyltransferase